MKRVKKKNVISARQQNPFYSYFNRRKFWFKKYYLVSFKFLSTYLRFYLVIVEIKKDLYRNRDNTKIRKKNCWRGFSFKCCLHIIIYWLGSNVKFDEFIFISRILGGYYKLCVPNIFLQCRPCYSNTVYTSWWRISKTVEGSSEGE